jgi:hypothetical protein
MEPAGHPDDLPAELRTAILRFLQAAPDPHRALGAVLGTAAGCVVGQLGPRGVAEALWAFGDATVARGDGHG